MNNNNTPTPQQQAVYDAVVENTGHVIISAVAGSGKTTTALGCAGAAQGRGKVGFIAFNRHIVAELRAQLNDSARACTLHSLGFAAVRRACSGVQIDENKPKQLLSRLFPAWTWKGARGGLRVREEGQAVLHLARLAKYTLADETSHEELSALVSHYGVDMPEDRLIWPAVYNAVATLLDETTQDLHNIDYDDQVWLPVRLDLPVEHFDLLMVDEVQDLSRVQQALALRAVGDGRLIPLGDISQSLYGFAGADPEAFPRLASDLVGSPRGATSCPLTWTFRCPRSHVEIARRLVPEIESAPWAVDGRVTMIGEDDLCRYVCPGDMVLARRNAPLLTLAFELIADGVPVLVRGRDLGKGLLDLIDRLGGDNPVQLLGELHLYHAREVEKLERKDAPESQFQALEDRVNCLRELAACHPTLRALRDTIGRLFADDSPEGKVVLSSIHRAKGLEADRVVIIDTESLPLVRTCRGCRGHGCPKCEFTGTRTKRWEYQQELNLCYVAITRAKRELVFVDSVPPILGGSW